MLVSQHLIPHFIPIFVRDRSWFDASPVISWDILTLYKQLDVYSVLYGCSFELEGLYFMICKSQISMSIILKT